MGETIERVLKPYKGHAITKFTENKGLFTEDTYYMANTDDDELGFFDCAKTLAEMKRKIDIYLG